MSDAPCPAEWVPRSLLAPCPVPAFTVQTWGDYPEYVVRLHLALEMCSADKATVARLLQIHTQTDPARLLSVPEGAPRE